MVEEKSGNKNIQLPSLKPSPVKLPSPIPLYALSIKTADPQANTLFPSALLDSMITRFKAFSYSPVQPPSSSLGSLEAI